MKGIKHIALSMAASITLMACNNSPSLSGTETLPGTWVVKTIQNNAVINNSQAKFIFTDQSQLSGSASCNQFSTRYSHTNQELKIQPIATTRKMCPQAIMKQESLLLKSLQNSNNYTIQQGKLSLFDQHGVLQLTADKVQLK